jgi:predicted nucleotide-binding protein
MAGSIPEVLRLSIKKKLGNVSDRHVNRTIAKVADDEVVSRRAAAMLLARKLKINYNRYATAEDRAEMRGHTLTAASIETPEPAAAASRAKSIPELKVRPAKYNSLFVVHGRDAKLNEAMFSILRAMGLNPLEWSQAIAKAKGANPDVGKIIDTAMKKVQGVIVMFSPDEEARLKSEFRGKGDSATLEGQARQNVTFEAGLALGAHPKKTLLVQVGHTRPISDIAGKHMLRLSNSSTSRKELGQRLKKLGFKVELTGTSWLTEGDFDR